MQNSDKITQKIFRIEGRVQYYDWGGKSFIPNLISQKNPTNNTYAEYWLGVHTKAPSMVKVQQENISLDVFLNQNPTENLGLSVVNNFGKLPYLFKVLDVHQMLSIQVHPTIEAAKKGFELENKKGIPLTANNRNYKDKNHKPEIMVALSDFWLLHGFLERAKLIKNLKDTEELNFLLKTFLVEGYLGLYKKVMEFTQEEVNNILSPLLERISIKFLKNELEKSSPAYWAAKSVAHKDVQNLDKGIFSIYFFNILHLSVGEAIFQDAGVPHAYLEGKNMELMANSDNVLRGGLTSKHIDVEELLKNTRFEETIPTILYGNKYESNGELVYQTNTKDFEMTKVELVPSIVHRSVSNSVEILIAIRGSATITENENTLPLEKGQSILIKPNTAYAIQTNSEVEIYKARVPK
jgi:mannose-6-phosphate isomerase